LVDLSKYYRLRAGVSLNWRGGFLKAVDGVTLKIQEGKSIALVGESGCGKTTIAKLVLKLEMPTKGRILFDGKDIKYLSKAENAEYRVSIQAVFQNPYASLNPRMRIGDAIAEPIMANKILPGDKARERVIEVVKQVGLPPDSVSYYPHEFSGGQRQRVAVARALVTKPRFVVLDEPVSALDVSIRAQIMNLLKRLQEELGLGYLLISHDLATSVHLSHWVVVIYAGKVVEILTSTELYHDALHPYTRALLNAASPERLRAQDEDFVLPGEVPDPLNPPAGCRFHPRCSYQEPRCHTDEPPLQVVSDTHSVRCHLIS